MSIKKIKVGLVGINFGNNVAKNKIINGAGGKYFELVALCDTQIEKCTCLAKEYGVKAYFAIEDLLNDPQIEAVILITGPIGRAKLIRQIIDAGKPIMTTKPFELNSAEAYEVLTYAKEKKVPVQMNSPAPSLSEDFKIIESWVEKYQLGRPICARHECWYKRVEEADGSWYDDPEQCPAAPIFRLGIYGINDMVRLLGAPESVQVTQSRIFTGRPTPDIALMTIKFKNGCIAETLDGWCLQPARGADSLVLYYENGTIHRNPVLIGGNGFASTNSKLCVIPAENADGKPAEVKEVNQDQLSNAYQWDVFYKTIQGEKIENETPIEKIVDSIKIIEAMKRSMKSGATELV